MKLKDIKTKEQLSEYSSEELDKLIKKFEQKINLFPREVLLEFHSEMMGLECILSEKYSQIVKKKEKKK